MNGFLLESALESGADGPSALPGESLGDLAGEERAARAVRTRMSAFQWEALS